MKKDKLIEAYMLQIKHSYEHCYKKLVYYLDKNKIDREEFDKRC